MFSRVLGWVGVILLLGAPGAFADDDFVTVLTCETSKETGENFNFYFSEIESEKVSYYRLQLRQKLLEEGGAPNSPDFRVVLWAKNKNGATVASPKTLRRVTMVSGQDVRTVAYATSDTRQPKPFLMSASHRGASSISFIQKPSEGAAYDHPKPIACDFGEPPLEPEPLDLTSLEGHQLIQTIDNFSGSNSWWSARRLFGDDYESALANLGKAVGKVYGQTCEEPRLRGVFKALDYTDQVIGYKVTVYCRDLEVVKKVSENYTVYNYQGLVAYVDSETKVIAESIENPKKIEVRGRTKYHPKKK